MQRLAAFVLSRELALTIIGRLFSKNEAVKVVIDSPDSFPSFHDFLEDMASNDMASKDSKSTCSESQQYRWGQILCKRTIGRVAAGAVAKKILKQFSRTKVWLGLLRPEDINHHKLTVSSMMHLQLRTGNKKRGEYVQCECGKEIEESTDLGNYKGSNSTRFQAMWILRDAVHERDTQRV